jgi:hypothetical protein
MLTMEDSKGAKEDLLVEDGIASAGSTSGIILPCLSRRQQKAGLLVFSLLYIPLFAGAFFGFGPMQIMLEESGAFSSLCDTTNSTTEGEVCPAQTAQLLTM